MSDLERGACAYLVGAWVDHAVGPGPEGADPLGGGDGALVLRVWAQL